MGQSRLRRVLNAYAIHDPQVGYVQGMNFIAAYFLLYASEEDTFWLLDAIMRKPKFGLANVYSNGMSKLHVAMYQTDMALKQVAPRLQQLTEVLWLQRNFTAMLEDALDANGNRMSDSD